MGRSFNERETWSDISSLNRPSSFDEKCSWNGFRKSKPTPPANERPVFIRLSNNKIERLTLAEYHKILVDHYEHGGNTHLKFQSLGSEAIQQYCIDSTPKWRANDTKAIANDAKHFQTEIAKRASNVVPYKQWQQYMFDEVEKGHESKHVFIIIDDNVSSKEKETAKAVKKKQKKRSILRRMLCFK